MQMSKCCQGPMCSKTFGMFTKKYVCRMCNQNFCGTCSVKDVAFPEYGVIIGHRVCKACVQSVENKSSTSGGSNTPVFSFGSGVSASTSTGDKSSMDQQLEEMMDEQQLAPAVRERMRAMDNAQKWNILLAYKQMASADKTRSSHDPLDMVDRLGRQGKGSHWKSAEKMRKLAMIIKSESKTWATQFVRGDGLLALLEGLAVVREQPVREAALECLLNFIHTETGLQNFLDYPASVMSLAAGLLTDADVARCHIAQVFAFVCSADLERGYPLIYEALIVPSMGKTRFKYLVDVLRDSSNVQLCCDLMVLINALVNNPDHISDRQHTRFALFAAGLEAAITRLRGEVTAKLQPRLPSLPPRLDAVPSVTEHSDLSEGPPSPRPHSLSNSSSSAVFPATPPRQPRPLLAPSSAVLRTPAVANATNEDVNVSSITSAASQLLVQLDLFDSSAEQDRLEIAREALDLGDVSSVFEHLRTEILPVAGEYFMPLLQLYCTVPVDLIATSNIWGTIYSVTQHILSGRTDGEVLTYDDMFALADRIAAEKGIGGPSAVAAAPAAPTKPDAQVAELTAELDAAKVAIAAKDKLIQEHEAALAAASATATASAAAATPVETGRVQELEAALETARGEAQTLRTQLAEAEKKLVAAEAKAAAVPAPAAPASNIPPAPFLGGSTIPPAPVLSGNIPPAPVLGGSNIPPAPFLGAAPAGNIPPAPFLGGSSIPPAPVLSGNVPPAPVLGGNIPPAPFLGGGGNIPPAPFLGGANIPPAPVLSGIPPAPSLGNVPPAPFLGSGAPPAPFLGSGPPPAPFLGSGPPPAPSLGGAPPAPFLGSGAPPAPSLGGPPPAPFLGGAPPAPSLGGAPPAPSLGGPPMAPSLGGPPMAPSLGGPPMAPMLGGFGAPPAPVMPVGPKLPYVKKELKPKSKMRAIHWTKVDDGKIEGTLWEQLNDDTNVKLDLDELEAMFAQAMPKRPLPGAAAEEEKEQKPAVKQLTSFVDGQRSQNISIAMSRFKLKNEEIRDAIMACDLATLTADRVSTLIKWLPTSEEIEGVTSFDGPISELAAVDQYVLALAKIPRLQRRLEVMAFKHQFAGLFEEVHGKMSTCLRVLRSIKGSKALRRVLEYVLALGNYLNGGTKKGGAYGFQVAFLTRLQDTKTSDNKSTLLHYLIDLIDKDPVAEKILDDLDGVAEAVRIELPALQAEVAKVTGNMRKTESELDAVLKAAAANDKLADVIKPFVVEAKPKAETLTTELADISELSSDIAKAFGEDPKKLEADAIFQLFNEFAGQVKRTREAIAKVKAAKEREERLAAAKKNAPTPASPAAPAAEAGTPDAAPKKIGMGMGLPGMGPAGGAGGAGGGDHLNQLQLAMRARMEKTAAAGTAANSLFKGGDEEGKLDKKVNATLTGNDSSAIMKEINARRAARTANGNTLNTKRLFGMGGALPTAP